MTTTLSSVPKTGQSILLTVLDNFLILNSHLTTILINIKEEMTN